MGRPPRLPRRLAGDGGGDDAAVEPAADPALRRRQPAAGATRRAREPPSSAATSPSGRRSARSPSSATSSCTAAVDAVPALAGAPVAHRGQRARARRRLPVLEPEGPVPVEVPRARPVPARPLPPRRRGRLPARIRPRPVLPRLLLGADARDVRRRCRGALVDGRADRGDGVREDGPARASPHAGRGRSGCSRSRRSRSRSRGFPACSRADRGNTRRARTWRRLAQPFRASSRLQVNNPGGGG